MLHARPSYYWVTCHNSPSNRPEKLSVARHLFFFLFLFLASGISIGWLDGMSAIPKAGECLFMDIKSGLRYIPMTKNKTQTARLCIRLLSLWNMRFFFWGFIDINSEGHHLKLQVCYCCCSVSTGSLHHQEMLTRPGRAIKIESWIKKMGSCFGELIRFKGVLALREKHGIGSNLNSNLLNICNKSTGGWAEKKLLLKDYAIMYQFKNNKSIIN